MAILKFKMAVRTKLANAFCIVLIEFLDPQNMGIETKIKSLGVPYTNIFSGNIANIIPGSPLKKMIPLMEDHGGGGGAWGPPLAYGLEGGGGGCLSFRH